MTVAFFATLPNHVHHLAPLWSSQGWRKKYPFYALRSAYETAVQFLGAPNVERRPPPPGAPTIVAGIHAYQSAGGGRKMAMVEHGCGQTYLNAKGEPDRNPSSPGGIDRGCDLFLNPNARVAKLNADAYPHSLSPIVGSPRVDYLTNIYRSQPKRRGPKPRIAPPPVIGITFKWDNRQSPFALSALPHYQSILPVLARNYTVIGTAHPRAYDRVRPLYMSAGIESTPQFENIVRRCDVLIADSTSAGPEFMAATGKPVLWLNAPWYDRSTLCPPRFWDWTTDQPSVDSPDDLLDALSDLLSDPDAQLDRRNVILDSLYANRGHAIESCWEAIQMVLEDTFIFT